MKTLAFWLLPFVRAETVGSEPPLIHDSAMPLLYAAKHSDPNPIKGEDELVVTEGSALVAAMGPEGTLADISEDEGDSYGGEISVYTVQEGDTVSNIADKFGVSVNTIRWANNLTKTSTITPGTTLVVLPVSGVQHTVGRGETLAGIAKKYSSDASDIASFNGIDASDALKAGDTLIIPGGEMSVAAPVKKPAAKTPSKSTIKQGGGLSSLGSASGGSASGYFGHPVPGGRISQGVHGSNGIDISAPSGTPVYAAAGGTVIVSRVGGWNGGYGNYIVIKHANGTQTLYSHLLNDNVSVGESVTRGQAIGTVGRTGQATGNHLHFEVRGARNPFAGCSEGSSCSPK